MRRFWAAAIGVLALGVFVSTAQAQTAGRRWAMLVGVDQYTKIENLEYAGNDQRTLAAELSNLGFPADQIRLLHDVAKQKRNLPFRENIERELDLMLKLAGPNDLVVFAFSGHGVHLDGKSYLCPTEADFDRPRETLIPLDGVFDKLGRCPAALKVMLVDACRNDPRPAGARSGNNGDRSITNEFAASLENPPEGLLLMTSCSAGQTSMEDAKLQHGVFMYYVLDGLRGKAANSEGVITLNGLYDYVSLSTKKYVADRWASYQSPGFKGELTGPFELARVDLTRPKPREGSGPMIADADYAAAQPLTGVWTGTYQYRAGSGNRSVNFALVVIQDGTELTGFIKEANTFGSVGDPWLHASFDGYYNSDSRTFGFTKTYDGTADVDHNVIYRGTLAADDKTIINGVWQIPGDWSGRFNLVKDTDTRAGRSSGIWTGTTYFPEVLDKQPVRFSMLVVECDTGVLGYIKERRSFLQGDDPWYHSDVYGYFDENGKLSLNKTFDGTAGKTGEVEYWGELSAEEGNAYSGEWKPKGGSSGGSFTIVKAPSAR